MASRRGYRDATSSRPQVAVIDASTLTAMTTNPARPKRTRRWRLRAWSIALVAASVALTGCRLDVDLLATIHPDGSGEARLVMTLDASMVAILDEVAVDPTATLTASITDTPWRLDRRVGPDGALTITLHRDVADVDELAAALTSLSAGSADGAGGLIVEVQVDDDGDGNVAVAGSVLVRAPTDLGVRVDGVAQGPSPERLEELTRETVDTRVTIALPGRIVTHNGDDADGDHGRVTWQVPVGVERQIITTAVRADPAWIAWAPSWFGRWLRDTSPVVAAIVVAAVVTIVTAGGVTARRRWSVRSRR